MSFYQLLCVPRNLRDVYPQLVIILVNIVDILVNLANVNFGCCTDVARM